MKHPTRKPSPSDEVVTIGSTTYERLWAEAVSERAAVRYSESDGWLTAEQFGRRAGIHKTTARSQLESMVECGKFEKRTGVNRLNLLTHYFRPIAQNPKKEKNRACK